MSIKEEVHIKSLCDIINKQNIRIRKQDARIAELEAELNKIRPPKGFHCVGWGWHEWLGVNTYIMRFLPIENTEQQSATDFEEGEG